MTIYVLSSVKQKEYEYVDFLIKNCGYNIDEAETKYQEVEYQIKRHCSPILMKAGSSGTIKFKSVLQRQEIERFVNDRSQLMRIINRRKGKKGITQWVVDYVVSVNGDVFITAIKCYNTFTEEMVSKKEILINESQLRSIIRETIRRINIISIECKSAP